MAVCSLVVSKEGIGPTMRTVLEYSARTQMSGGALSQLRRDGFIPASISKRGEDTQQCTVSRQKLEGILHGHGGSALIELQLPGESRSMLVIARDTQKDPISGKLIHVGFQVL